MKAVAYLRKSTSGVGENGVERQEGSFDRQRAVIEDYARKSNFTITKWYEDEASGKTLRKRKKFLEMVRDAKAGKFKIILFSEYDRFMRNVREAWRYELELQDAGVELHFSNFRNDGSDAEETYKDMFRRMAASYSKNLAEKCIQGMLRKARMGSWLGGVPPYGYRARRLPDGRVELAVHGAEAKIVEEIFRLSLKGLGHMRIAETLNERGVPSGEAARARNSVSNQNPDGKWGGNSVRMILRNQIYKGVYRWNKAARVDCFDWSVKDRGTVEIGKFRHELPGFKREDGVYVERAKPEDKWIEKPGSVPAIIQAEIFDEVQARFKPYVSRGWNRSNNVKYLMAKGLRCANCGNNCHGHRYNKVLKSTGERHFYEFYRCSGHTRKGTHGDPVKPMIKRQAVDDAVIGGILKRAGAFASAERVRELFKNRLRDFLGSRPNRLAQVEDELAKVEKEIQRTIEAYAKFDAPIPEEKRLGLMRRKRELESELGGLVAAGETSFSFDIDREADGFLAGARDVKKLLDSVHPTDRIRCREWFLKSAEIRWFPDRNPDVKLCWYRIPRIHGGAGPSAVDLAKEGPAPEIIIIGKRIATIHHRPARP